MTYLYITKTYVAKHTETVCNTGDVGEELSALLAGHFKHVSDALALEFDVKGFSVVTLTVTNVTGNVYIGKEVHLYLLYAVALTRLASAAAYVKAEAARFVAAELCAGGLCEKVADVGEKTGIGGGIGSWRTSDRTLVDGDHLVKMLHTLDFL